MSNWSLKSTRSNGIIRFISHIAGWLVFTLTLQLFSVPLPIAVLVAAAASHRIVRRQGHVGHIVIAASVVLAISFFEVGARIVNSQRSYTIPHDMFSVGGQPYYQPNLRLDDFEIPNGGLIHMSDWTQPTIIVPRRVRFATDSLGFRNSSDYAAQHYVLLGDSFGLGVSSSQEDSVPELLTLDHKLPTYNLSWPADPRRHVDRLLAFRKTFIPDFEAIVMIFEGNDFGKCASEKAFAKRWYGQVLKPIRKKAESYQVISRILRKTTNWLGLTKAGEVSVWNIGGKDVGFYDHYVAVSRRTSLRGCGVDRKFSRLTEIQNDIALLVFVPTKFRTYHALLREADHLVLPNLQSEFLERIAKQLQIPYLDLTPALEEQSRLLLAEGQYTFWRDDTHWSAEGMKIAAQEIAAQLRSAAL